MNIDKQIEFDKVKEIWSDLAVTDGAKEKIKEVSIYFSENELRKHLRDTSEARSLIEKMGTPPLQNISEIKDILKISEKGDCLTPYQLERVETVLVAIRRLKDYLTKGKMFNNSLAYYDENLDFVSELYEEIRSKIRNGAVDDFASKELLQIRKEIVKCEEQMKQKAEQILNCIMAQCGLHVTCRQADICMNSAYLCDIGDGQNLSENLSTFSAHITNVLEVLKEANKDSFVIMDELGSGTDPTEGMGIAIAILEELKKSGAIFLVTTHYPEVKEYAAGTKEIVNARMAFDKDSLRPTYQMIIGEAGESCAFYIADRLGMPTEMLKVAISAAYGEDAVNSYSFHASERNLVKKGTSKIVKAKSGKKNNDLSTKYKIGDSVMVFPEKKIGIVCVPINEKGVLRVQLPDKKIWINHKRVKLHVAATELYPEDYDFSIIFETVENRKKRHDMQRKYTDDVIVTEE